MMQTKRSFLSAVSLLTAAAFVLATTTAFAQTELNSLNNPFDDVSQNNQYQEIMYDEYLVANSSQSKPNKSISVPVIDVASSEHAEIGKEVDKKTNTVSFSEGSKASWIVDVEQEGLYNISVDYTALQGKGGDVQFALYINGEIPFFEANYFTMSRVWKDSTDILQDFKGNDKKPESIEVIRWNQKYLNDYLGYHDSPFLFYFKQGTNTVEIEGIRENFALSNITLNQCKTPVDYSQYKNENKGKDNNPSAPIILEAEKPSAKSTTTVYAINDRSSKNTSPHDYYAQRLNTVGGQNWNKNNQWLEYTFNITQSGYYKISFRAKQNFAKGANSYRTIYLDDKIQFSEMKNVPFQYESNWYYKTLGDETPYEFYLDEGEHTIRIEAQLGLYTDQVRRAQQSVKNLNVAYRKALMLMGSSPDQYRDYNVASNLPDVVEIFRQEKVNLESISKAMNDLGITKSDRSAVIDRFIFQLNGFINDPETLPKRMDSLKQNIGALGTWMAQTSEQPLRLDSIIISSTEHNLGKADAGFFGKFAHNFQNFMASFFVDYSSISASDDNTVEPITVWIPSGRDQANVLNRIMAESLPSNLNVNLRLVNGGVLLPSVVAGRGPDVMLQVGSGEPINFAIRGGVYELSQFDDCNDVLKRFSPSALEPVQFNGKTYALPETESFPVLFYRKDILDELELEVPQTWNEVVALISVLQQNNMSFGFNDSMDNYAMLLYQNGGSFYLENGKKSGLSEEPALQAFNFFTELFASYKIPLTADFNNRFRTGEMPIGISNFTTYNTLVVFAPEINGLWEMTIVPGTVKPDGTIDRTVATGSTDCMIINTTTKPEQSWEFLKWWTSKQTQISYGQNIESIFGPSGRYSPANLEAFDAMQWSSDQLKTINAQKQWIKGMPNVPGGYFTSRHFSNAFRKVVYSQSEYRETMLEYVDTINKELTNKRKEFGLVD